MDTEADMQIRKVRSFGRSARPFCILIAVLLAVVALTALGTLAAGTGSARFALDLGDSAIASEHITTGGAKAWTAAVIVSVFGLLFAGLFQLYRLFGNLAAGSIYTQDTVQRIRKIGLLALAGAVLQVLVRVSFQLLADAGGLDAAMVVRDVVPRGALTIGTAQLPGLCTAGLILLASWIMEVGRKTTDEAESLRRDAELVV